MLARSGAGTRRGPSLELESGSFVDDGLASTQSDLLFRVQVSRKPGLVYLLFEHQSTVDELMALRLAKYVLCILDRHVETSGSAKQALPLPVVIPVVLHHSASGWSAATALEGLFAPSPALAPFVPKLRFVLDDISHLTDEQLAQRALGLVPALTLWVLRDSRNTRQLIDSLRYWLSAMQALARAPTGRDRLITIFRYLSLAADDLTPQIIYATLAQAPDAQEQVMTLAEIWKAEGEAEGKAEGKAEGLRQVVLLQLQLKFGAVNADIQASVAAAPEEQLLRWVGRILSAESIDAIFAA